jgi:hypothetical protein
VQITFECATTHLYVKGPKFRTENAVGCCGSTQETFEVMGIANVLGMQATMRSVPILVKGVAKYEEEKNR